MKNRVIKVIVLNIIFYSILYIAFGFVANEFNTSNWDIWGRFSLVFCFGITSVITYNIYY